MVVIIMYILLIIGIIILIIGRIMFVSICINNLLLVFFGYLLVDLWLLVFFI